MTVREFFRCSHESVQRGSDVPRVYGSWRSEVCLSCGAWRTMGHVGPPFDHVSKWRPASTLEEALRENDE